MQNQKNSHKKILPIWNDLKISMENNVTTYRKDELKFAEGEIWWCSIGQNLGSEIYGKGEQFVRPVLILKKVGKYTYIGLPSTTKYMNIRNKSMISKVFQLDEQSVFRYDQIRTFDSIRLQEKISTLLSQDFKQIQEGITQYMFSST